MDLLFHLFMHSLVDSFFLKLFTTFYCQKQTFVVIEVFYFLFFKIYLLIFSDKVKLKKFIITKPLLYEMLKGFI